MALLKALGGGNMSSMQKEPPISSGMKNRAQQRSVSQMKMGGGPFGGNQFGSMRPLPTPKSRVSGNLDFRSGSSGGNVFGGGSMREQLPPLQDPFEKKSPELPPLEGVNLPGMQPGAEGIRATDKPPMLDFDPEMFGAGPAPKSDEEFDKFDIKDLMSRIRTFGGGGGGRFYGDY